MQADLFECSCQRTRQLAYPFFVSCGLQPRHSQEAVFNILTQLLRLLDYFGADFSVVDNEQTFDCITQSHVVTKFFLRGIS